MVKLEQAQELWLRTPAGATLVDLAAGHLRETVLVWQGRELRPLHSAPWVGGPVPPGGPDSDNPVVAHLSGDFFCAPFGGGDGTVPAHGWPASSSWTPTPELAGDHEVACVLDRDVLGARLTKWVRIGPSAPLLYQRHLLQGGQGRLPLAHHGMTRVATSGRVSCSPKELLFTHAETLPGEHQFLAYPATASSLAAVPAAAGGTLDLRDYPPAARGDDFLVMVERDRAAVGWTAIVRASEGDVVFTLKDAAVLPVTMLWMSNGGRELPPWNGRHTGVFAFEEGRSLGRMEPHLSCADNELTARGVPTCAELVPAGAVDVRQVIGALPTPAGWNEVVAINVGEGEIELVGDGGTPVVLACDTQLLRGGRA